MISAIDIASLARQIAKEASNEASIRNGVGRSYYAAFHHCKAAADRWCDPLPATVATHHRGKDHEALILRLSSYCKVPEVKGHLSRAAEETKKLRVLRRDADYELVVTVSKGDLARGLLHLTRVETEFAGAEKVEEKKQQGASTGQQAPPGKSDGKP